MNLTRVTQSTVSKYSRVLVVYSEKSSALITYGLRFLKDYLQSRTSSRPVIIITGKSYRPWIHNDTFVHELVFSLPHELLELHEYIPNNTGFLVFDQCEEYFQKTRLPRTMQNQFYASLIGKVMRTATILVLRLQKKDIPLSPVLKPFPMIALQDPSSSPSEE